MSIANTIIGLVLGVLGIAGLLALAASVFRIKTRDDTIASQRGYIEAVTQERDGCTRRVTILEGRVEVLTKDFARELGVAVADVVREELRRGDQ